MVIHFKHFGLKVNFLSFYGYIIDLFTNKSINSNFMLYVS